MFERKCYVSGDFGHAIGEKKGLWSKIPQNFFLRLIRKLRLTRTIMLII